MIKKVVQNTLCAEIRQMDKLMRKANSAYPRISPYRVSHRVGKKEISPHYIDWINKIGSIVDAQRAKDSSKSFLDIIFDSTIALRKNKLGDCAESSSLIMSSLLSNGYKDGKIARLIFEAEARDLATNQLVGRKVFDTTHEFVVRNLADGAISAEPKSYGKNLIIIDAWEGFCGNLQESFKRYYDSFMGGMREWINTDANLKITYKPKLQFFNFDSRITSEDLNKFKDGFPELII